MSDSAIPLSPTSARVRVSTNGPYVVSAGLPLGTRTPVKSAAGEAIDWTAGEDRASDGVYALCRCGRSANKPYCDRSHRSAGFDGTCTADRAPGATRRKVLQGVGITMTDDDSLCAGYEYCDRHGGVWRTIAATADPATRDELMKQIAQCPSGRLQYIVDGQTEPAEPAYTAAIATIPDGPLWLMGRVPVETADGFTYEVRNRQLLCRCGASSNKPFCDGTHHKIGFRAP